MVLREFPHQPINVSIPGDFFPEEYRIKEEPDPDVRISQEEADRMVEPRNEFYDDEKDNDKEMVIKTEEP